MKHIIYPLLYGTLLLLGSGCAYYQESSVWQRPGSLGSDIPSYRPPAKPGGSPDSPALIEPIGKVNLHQALSLALMQSPELAGFAWEVRSAEARALQAGAIPNPELEIEVEDVSNEGLGHAVTSMHLSQPIELGGKRRKRAQVAHLEADAAGWEYETARLDVLTSATKAFVEVDAAQERLVLAEELLVLANQMLSVVSKRVEAGKDSPIEEIKAQVSIASAEIEERKAGSDLITARKHLAAHWGNSSPVFDDVEGDLDILRAAPALSELSARVSQNPDIAGWDTAIEQLQHALALEKANRVPDLAVGVGLDHSNAEQETTYRFRLAVPIPLFDRNQGGIREAQCNLAKAGKERAAVEASVLAELTEAYQTLVSAYDEAVALRDDVLPAAARAFEGTSDGFRKGRYSYLEVLDVQRTLFELKSQYIDALAAYHSARADVERLIAESLDGMTE